MANDNNNAFPKPPSFSNLPENPLGQDQSNFEETPENITESSFKLPEIPAAPTTPTPSAPSITSETPKTDPDLPQPATLPNINSSSPTSSLLTLILLILAGTGISASIFMYSQSTVLKKQLSDITKTLDQQKTLITPTPTPTIIDIPTPTPTTIITPTATPSATPSATVSPTPSATASGIAKIMPFGLAPQALKIGLNHEPNAQLLLVKVENGENENNFLIKYFFRKDLTTKKYFYVTIDSKNESEIKTNSVYVNPDNNIPSLNDQVLGNKLGTDYADIYKIVTDSCTKEFPSLNCKTIPVTAQFIVSNDINIWQITLTNGDDKLVYQLNSKTKEFLYKPSK